MINFHTDQRVYVVTIDPTHPVAQQHGGVAVPGFLLFKKGSDAPVYSSVSAIKFSEVKDKVVEIIGADPATAAPVVFPYLSSIIAYFRPKFHPKNQNSSRPLKLPLIGSNSKFSTSIFYQR